MKILFLFSAISIFVTSLLGQTIERIDETKIPADSLKNKIEYLMKAANVCGVAVSIFSENKPVFSQAFGLANIEKNEPLLPSTVLYAASLSKMVFAYIVMQFAQQKVIDLDKPLVQYLDSPLVDYQMKKWKGYQDLKGDDRYKKITGRMCLDHTTGFPNWRWVEPDQKLRIKTEPGTHYSYSGEGIYLLQFVIEQITHKDYESIAQEMVFKPFGMSNTSYVWLGQFDDSICYGYNPKGEPYPRAKRKEPNAAGSMNTTLSDFTKFYTALIEGKNLSKQSFIEMTDEQIKIRSVRQFGPLSSVDSSGDDNIHLGYGLGVGVFQTPYGRAFFKEGHDDGWEHYSVCYPDKKVAIVIMTNSDNGESIFRDLLAYAIGDIFTPWQWESYLPYELKNK